MGLLAWTDPAPVDGTTLLTSARWEQLKTDIGAVLGVVAGAAGAVDGNNIPDGTVTRAKLAVGNRDVTWGLTIPLNKTTLAVATDVGFTHAGGAATEIWGPAVEVDMTLVRAEYVADYVATSPASFQPARAGVAVGTADSLAVLGTPSRVTSTQAVAYTTGQRVGVLVQGSGGTTNVRGAFAVYRFTRPLV